MSIHDQPIICKGTEQSTCKCMATAVISDLDRSLFDEMIIIHLKEKRWRLYILPQHLHANQTNPIGYIKRYGLTTVVPTLYSIVLVEF